MRPHPAAAARPPGLPVRVVHHLENVMGTIVIIDVYAAAGSDADSGAGRPAGELGRQLAEAVAVLNRADATFSTWRPDSPVSRLRRGEITSAQAPAEVAEVLERCAVARDLSAGWFDPWAMPGGLDPSGYVKGWAAQHALAAFSASGICGVTGQRRRRHRQYRRPGRGHTVPDRHHRSPCGPPPRGDRRADRGDRHLRYLRAGRPPHRSSLGSACRTRRLGQRDRA